MNSYRKYGIALLAGAMLLAGWAGNAMAWTNACEVISNQASLTYYVGGTLQPQVDSTDDPAEGDVDQLTEFAVGTRVDLTVGVNPPVNATGLGNDGAGNAGADVANNVMTFSITNTGNDEQRYSLRLLAAAVGEDGGTAYTDEFDMTTVRVYTDNDNDIENGYLLQISADALTDGSHLGYTPTVNGNNGVIYVHVVGNVPAGRVNGDNALYALQAVTHQVAPLTGDDGSGNPVAGGESTENAAVTTNGCGNVIVLADNDGDAGNTFSKSSGGDLGDAARNGDGYAVGVYIVNSAAISMTKRYSVVDDYFGGTKAIPGARVRYTMHITNGTATPATSLEMVDQIPNFTDFFVGSISAPGGATIEYSYDNGVTYEATAPTAGGNGADPTVDFIKVSTFDLNGNSSVDVSFDVLIE
ncbi:MAG: hypothetical protein FIB02_05420 [Desulfuromonas sp.]|nr:hypothetical protein [Desulfuromonas sp.]